MRRRHKFYELHGYKRKIHVFFWGKLSISRYGFTIWPKHNHGGWQFHLKTPHFRFAYAHYSVIPTLTWSRYWLIPKRAELERRILIIRWCFIDIWLDLWPVDKIKRTQWQITNENP